ncbi:hypothetical protein EMCG_02811 [[Emmonsia] crescens]|uniref:Uncharacterized protein n=1 Tax=[Emmonsia] crescens TaxID=73230 RepID=A0A0G2J8U0_9EURO|nr:hypothetical protein EMCG_02811 [Emmonsia crescens UAMH 3008]
MPSSDYSFLCWEDAGDSEMSDGPEEEAEGLQLHTLLRQATPDGPRLLTMFLNEMIGDSTI